MRSIALSFLALCCIAVAVQAKIERVQIVKDDRALFPLTEEFGFAATGRIDVSLRDVVIWRRHDQENDYNLDNFGFFLSPADAEAALQQDIDDEDCPLRSANEHVLFTFKDSMVQKLINGEISNLTFHLSIENGGVFYLYFANCEPYSVSFDARIAMYNILPDGSKAYLSVGLTDLDTVYLTMFVLFFVISCAWGYMLYRNKDITHRIHVLMLALVVFKTLTVLCEGAMFHMIERDGSPEGWNIAFYIFNLFRGMLFFTVVVLVGMGWSYMKPFVGEKEKRILLILVPLQIFANIAIVITEEESPAVRDWFTWRDVFHLVDIICCCAILFPIVWSIKHLREASQTDGKAARCLEKLTLFRQFYVMVVVYIYFTRIVVYLLKSTMQYEYAWVSDSAAELATLAFYVWTGVKFRPQQNNPYLKLSQEEIEL